MTQEVKEATLKKTVHELIYGTKTSDEIIEGIVSDTYFNKLEASLIYIEALEKIVLTLREVGQKQNAKRKSRKRNANNKR